MENLKLVCILCPVGCRLNVSGEAENLKVEGGTCKRAQTYAYNEITNPVRTVCTTAKIKGGLHPVIPVKTDNPIPDKYKYAVVTEINKLELKSPIKMGDVVLADVFGTGVNMVATRSM